MTPRDEANEVLTNWKHGLGTYTLREIRWALCITGDIDNTADEPVREDDDE